MTTATESEQAADDNLKARFAMLVRLEAIAGKQAELENILRASPPVVMQEAAKTVWFGQRFGPTTFAIFDAFADEAGRQEHLAGRVAKALKMRADDLLSEPPFIVEVDVLAAKLPVAEVNLCPAR
jgi:hypothetical protein